MAVTLRATSAATFNASSQNLTLPTGSQVDDMCFMFIATYAGSNMPSGWSQVVTADSGGANPISGAVYSKVLDATDISNGYIAITTPGSFPATWTLVTFVGPDVAVRLDPTAQGGGISASGDRTVNSDTTVLTGDYCLLWAATRNWTDETYTAPVGVSAVQAVSSSTGASNCLYDYTAVADGSFSATHHSLWGGATNEYIVPLYEAVPPGAVSVEASESKVMAIAEGIAVDLRLSRGYTMAVFNFPAETLTSSEFYMKAVVENTTTVEASFSRVFAIVKGRVASHRVRCFTFSLDGHDFYVIHLGMDTTLVYDLTTGQWMEWTTPELNFWRANTGWNWISMGRTTFSNGHTSNVVIGDDTNGLLWTLEPEQGYDESTRESKPDMGFIRRVVGGVPMRMRETQKVGAAYLTANLGEPQITAANVTLRTSDDNGNNWTDHGTITVDPGNFDQEFVWRSLGLIRAPGRIFEITDDGAAVRIDGLDIR